MAAKQLGWRRVTAFGTVLLGFAALGHAPAQASTRPDSAAARLPFRLLDSPNGYFTVSNLTKAYGRDLSEWLKVQAPPTTDLAQLDRYGRSRPIEPAPAPAPEDSSDLALADAAKKHNPTELTPEEKAALTPPQPGVHVGIPGTVAATGALIGGLALLAKIVTEFLR
jgi:hypothetical protein